jgi:hypothetical protein
LREPGIGRVTDADSSAVCWIRLGNAFIGSSCVDRALARGDEAGHS